MKQKIEKWQREILRIQNAVTRLLDYRRWNRVYEQIVAANPLLRPGIPVLDYFRNIYGDYAVMAIRRQTRDQKDSISLIGLLPDLEENASYITRTWTRELYHQPTPGGTVYPDDFANMLADSSFQHFADASGEHLDPMVVRADIDGLEAATKVFLMVTALGSRRPSRPGIRGKLRSAKYCYRCHRRDREAVHLAAHRGLNAEHDPD